MKRLIGVALICAMSVSLVTGCSPDIAVTNVPEETVKSFSDRPQDDYYYYVNKVSLENAVFENGSTRAAEAFDDSKINEQLDLIIKEVVAGSGYEKGSEEYIIQAAYNAYLSYDFAKEPIPEEIIAVIDEIQNAKTVDELVELDARLNRDYGIFGYFRVMSAINYFKTDEHIASFVQYSDFAGVQFDDIREDNTALDSIVTDTRIYYQTLGYDSDTGSQYGRDLANLALKLYGSTDLEAMDASESLAYTTVCSADEIKNIFTNVDIINYLKTAGYDEKYLDRFSVMDKGQLECLNSLLVDENIDALKAWKIHDVYNEFMMFIAPHYPLLAGNVRESYDTPEQQAVDFVKYSMREQTDPLYVERYYTKETDDALRSMCDDVKEGYRNLISQATWLTESTRKGLLEKLDNIVYITGTNIKRQDPSKYAHLSGNLYELMRDYTRIMNVDSIKNLGEPVDRYNTGMEMQIVNACYVPALNSITITSAITNAPFFDINADYYTNLGGLGATIAHEMGHAFDSNCIVYDKTGAYNPSWIADEDMQILNERNKKAAEYFEDNFTVFGIYHVDGERTLGENYADLGGMECITSLCKTDEDLKKLFENYAVTWCCKKVDTSIMNQLAYDVHSPEVIRVNAILSTLDCFYEVYDVKEGDGMYIAPENRISRWY